jgi:hypothetical protein
MALHNVEPSLFKPGEYNAYDGRGYRWRVRKIRDKTWRADPSVNHPGRLTTPAISAHTLKSLAAQLLERK